MHERPPKLRNALLAWEFGGGRGHIVKLVYAAQALSALGVTCSAALCRLTHQAELRPFVESLEQAPSPLEDRGVRVAKGAPTVSTYGEWLGDLGYSDAGRLRPHLAAWRELISRHKPDLVVADQSPTALLAARTLGIPAVSIGIGYTAPPATLREFPVILPDFATRIYDETQMLTCVNETLASFGAAPLDAFPQVLGANVQLACTAPLFDPYAAERGDGYGPPLMAAPQDWPREHGDEIFVYLSSSDRSDPIILTAILELGAPTRVYIPNIPGETRALLESRGICVETGPVPLPLVASHSRIAFHAGNHGIALFCAAAGLPQIMIPQQLEQEFNARRIADAGIGVNVTRKLRTVPRIRSLVANLYEDSSIHERSTESAHRLRQTFTADPRPVLLERIVSALNRA